MLYSRKGDMTVRARVLHAG